MKTSLIFAGIVALIAFGLFGVLYILDRNTDLDQPVTVEDTNLSPKEPGLHVSSNLVAQGTALGFSVINVSSEPVVLWNDKPQSLIKIKNGYVGVVPIPLSSSPSEKKLKAKISDDIVLSETITITAKDYGQSVLVVPKRAEEAGKTSSTLVSGISSDDNERIRWATSKSNDNSYFDSGFVYPLSVWADVGAFGVSRKTDNTSIRHLGTDLEAEIGTAVSAINSGKVVLSDYLTNYGHTIIIDHGHGIFSLYLHLSARQVEEGDMVLRSEEIGKSGDTGLYSLEPHLHFSIRLNGNSIDPKVFIDSMNSVIGSV